MRMSPRFRWIRRTRHKFLKFASKISRKQQILERETASIPHLNSDVLQQIFENLDLKDRTRMRSISREFRSIVDKIPIEVPFLMIHSDESGNYELLSDQLDFLAGRLLEGISGDFKHLGDALAMNREMIHQSLQLIASSVSSINHLWLDCADNGQLAKTIVEANFGVDNVRKRLNLEQLTIIGSKDTTDFDWYRKLVLLSRRTLKALRLRHVRIWSDSQSSAFWQAVGQCHKLRLLQYEPCRVDFVSRELLVKAVQSKEIKNLTITGIDGLSDGDLRKMAEKGRLEELSVVSDSIKPSTLASKQMVSILTGLKSLLIQIDPWLSLYDSMERMALLLILKTLPRTSVFEVVHVLDSESRSIGNSNNQVGKALGYWMGLAMESRRTIKLKLDDISQEKLDSAVGRVLRKCFEVIRGPFTDDGIWLHSGEGNLLVLDRRTWFGDDDLQLH